MCKNLFRLIIYSYFLVLVFVQKANTQNPFDLNRPSLNPQPTADSTKSITKQNTTTIIPDSLRNPFDIVPPSPEEVSGLQQSTAKIREEVIKTISKPTDDPRLFLLSVILGMMVLLTLLVTLGRPFLGKVFQAFMNNNIFQALYKSKSSASNMFYLALYILFLINAGVFLYLITKQNNFIIRNSHLTTLLICLGGIFGAFAIRHLMLWVVRIIFPFSKDISIYQFLIIIFGIVLGIILAPINVMIAYMPSEMTSMVIYSAIGIIIFVYIFRGFRALLNGNKYVTENTFHFFMYLCAVEILPLVLLVKYISLQTGFKLI